MSPKDYGLAPVKINNFVHGVVKCQHDCMVEKQKADSSLVKELSAMVLMYQSISPDIFRQLMVPRLHSWGGPWKWVYVRKEVKSVLTLLVDDLNNSLPPRFVENLRQGINDSNTLSAMILARAFNQKLIFKANHVESNFGYRFAYKVGTQNLSTAPLKL